ncbi:MAG: ankyrin repeat domain-containing protein, partial [Candidatus Omnitrophica bacterium]|nr:ankyrin repeat domain-containing protein [Candidatus Omnitrophota bacterium]
EWLDSLIPDPVAMAGLNLSTPEKAFSQFIKAVNRGDMRRAYLCTFNYKEEFSVSPSPREAIYVMSEIMAQDPDTLTPERILIINADAMRWSLSNEEYKKMLDDPGLKQAFFNSIDDFIGTVNEFRNIISSLKGVEFKIAKKSVSDNSIVNLLVVTRPVIAKVGPFEIKDDSQYAEEAWWRFVNVGTGNWKFDLQKLGGVEQIEDVIRTESDEAKAKEARSLVDQLVESVNTKPKEEMQSRVSSSGDIEDNLWKAADEGNAEEIRSLLEKGADVNAKKENRSTPLFVASYNGNLDIVKLLLEKGADVRITGGGGNARALFVASQNGHLDIVKLLIENGADVNVKDDRNFTPLFAASGEGHLDIVKLLIENGADVNAQSNNGFTALMFALEQMYLDVAELLLEKGADVNMKTSNGKTALSIAETKGYSGRIVDLIREATSK